MPPPPLSPEMDPAIWSRLPEELLEYIICCLPPKHVFNLRSISKHFKSLIFNPSFLSRCYATSSPPLSSPSLSPFSSFLLLSHPQFRLHFPLYDSDRQDWRKFSVSLSSLFPNTNSAPSLLSTSNGLLCFSLPSSHSFLICNPLSKTSKLVRFPQLPFSFDSLELISTYNEFKIFVISTGSSSSSSSNSVVFLYESKTESWSEFSGFEPTLFIDNYYQQGVHRDGWLYFTTTEPFSVVGFNLGTGSWGGSSLSGADLPEDLTFIRLVSSGCGGGRGEEGRLYMVGGIGKNGISRSLKLWELMEEGGNHWEEVGTLPDLMYKKFVSVCYHNYEHVYCFWHQGLVCICCYTWPEVLYYRVGRRTWHWSPRCPSLYEKWSCGFRWFSFVPLISVAV